MVKDADLLRQEKTHYTLVFDHVLELKSSQRDHVLDRAIATFVAETDVDEGFTSDELLQSFFMEWLLFDFDYKSGKSMLEYFINFHPASVSAETIDGLRQSAESNFVSDFLIERVDPKDDMVTISDIRTGEEFEVLDHSLSEVLHQNASGIIGARLICIDGQWLFAGNPVYFLPVKLTDELKAIIRDTSDEQVSFIQMIRDRYGRAREEEIEPPVVYPGIEDRELRLKEISRLIEEWHEQGKIALGWKELSNAIKHDDSFDESPVVLLRRLLFVDEDDEVDLDAENLDNLNEIIGAVMDAWNLLPHDCLGGSSPIELIEKEQGLD